MTSSKGNFVNIFVIKAAVLMHIKQGPYKGCARDQVLQICPGIKITCDVIKIKNKAILIVFIPSYEVSDNPLRNDQQKVPTI